MCVSVNQECLGGWGAFWGYSHAFCRPGKCVQRSQWHSHPTYAHRAAHARMSVSPTGWRQRTKRPTWCWIWPAIRRMCVCYLSCTWSFKTTLCVFNIHNHRPLYFDSPYNSFPCKFPTSLIHICCLPSSSSPCHFMCLLLLLRPKAMPKL